jgi:myo-inositol-1(or 4)-monophosphatase
METELIARHVAAVGWAREAGRVLMTHFGRVTAEAKGRVDFVTEADRAAESYLLGRIRAEFPEDAILSEESGVSGADASAEWRWVVDPLDGTTNFLHTFPHFCVSIGLEKHGVGVSGVVYQPCTGELFEAPPSGGAFVNGQPLHASGAERLADCLFVTGFPYDRRQRVDFLLERVRRALMTGHGLRRSGSAALDLCFVAAGRVDVYWEFGTRPWDVAAARLMVERAGGLVTTIDGASHDYHGPSILASNGRVHQEAVALLGPDA